MSDTFSGGDIAAAVEQTTAPAASPAADQPSSDQAASATETPEPSAVSTDQSETGTPAKGEPPQERWPTILENARKKAAADAEKQWKERFGWAESLDPSELQAAREWYARANQDPVSFVTDLYQRVQNHPQYGPQLKSQAARILGQRGNVPVQASDQMPEPDIPTSESNGRPVVYSAEQLAKRLAWERSQMKAELLKELEPDLQETRVSRQEREFRQMAQQADDYARTTLTGLTDKPGFKEHSAEIKEAYAAMPLTDGRTEGEKLRDAYLQVMATKVIPSLSQNARQQVVNDINRKVGASTINPAQANTTPKTDWRDPKVSLEDALKMAWQESNAR